MKFLSASEVAELSSLLSRHNTRDSLLITLLLETAARGQEVLNIRSSDLNLDQMSVRISGLKRGRSREYPLSRSTFRKLKYLCYITNGHPFNIKTRRLREIWYQWRPANKRLHSLRHTRAIGIYRKTKDIKLTQQVLGHKSLTSTMVYVDYLYSVEELRRAL